MKEEMVFTRVILGIPTHTDKILQKQKEQMSQLDTFPHT